MGMFSFLERKTPPVEKMSGDGFDGAIEVKGNFTEEEKSSIRKAAERLWGSIELIFIGVGVLGAGSAMAQGPAMTAEQMDNGFKKAYNESPKVTLANENQIVYFADNNVVAQKSTVENGVAVEKKAFGMDSIYARVETHDGKATSVGIKTIGEGGTQTVFYDSEYERVDSSSIDSKTGAPTKIKIGLDGKVNVVELRNSKGVTTAKFSFEDMTDANGNTIMVLKPIIGAGSVKEGDGKAAFMNAQEAYEMATSCLAKTIGNRGATASR